jgi:hypothetical protein
VGDGDYLGMRGDYDITRVVADTQALLKADMPTLARMETLRRAVLYASRESRAGRAARGRAGPHAWTRRTRPAAPTPWRSSTWATRSKR